MNFVPGKAAVNVSPLDEMAVSRSSVPNFSPLFPRPWRRMSVFVCVDVGRTIYGSVWFTVDAPDLDITDGRDYFADAGDLRRKIYRHKSIRGPNVERLLLSDTGRYKGETLFLTYPQPTSNKQLQAPALEHKLTVGSRENAPSLDERSPAGNNT